MSKCGYTNMLGPNQVIIQYPNIEIKVKVKY